MAEKSLFTFDHLTAVAADLNQASDDLTQIVGTLDSALQRLNIGIVAWVQVIKTNYEDRPQYYEREELGYAKVDGTWGLAVRKLAGFEGSPEDDEVRDIWLFNDAPRGLRLRAVEKLPEVIDLLTRSAMKTAERLKKKVADTRGFAASMGLWQLDGEKGKK
jgi:hypothetical protein